MTLALAITPTGTTNTQEFDKGVTVPAGGGVFTFDVTGFDLNLKGIGAGTYTLSFIVLDGAGNRIGQFFGNPLTIGTAATPSINTVPTYSTQIAAGADFTAQWTLGNSGSVTAPVTLLAVITPVGTTNSKEFYRPASIPPGGAVINTVITISELLAAGISTGQFTVTFVVFDANDQRIGQFFGNPLTIGTASPTFSSVPAYSSTIGVGETLHTEWTLGNTGNATAPLELVIAITPAGTTNTREFSKGVSVPAGGGLFVFDVSGTQLSAAGIGAGNYTLAFIALDGAGNRVGQFFGSPLTISTVQAAPSSITSAPVAPSSTSPEGFLTAQQITSGDLSGLVDSWSVPAQDPLAGQLLDRAFAYDQAIAVLALLSVGNVEQALKILQALAALEAGTGHLGFVYRTGSSGADFPAVFTGSNAWVGDAFVTYELATGDSQFRSVAERIADALLSFKDPASGLLRGGIDADGSPYRWVSTEHNLDAYFFLDKLAALTGDDRYRQAADQLSEAIDAHLWAGDHFRQGLGDDLIALDVQALGGIYLVSIGDSTRAETVRTFIENNFKRTVRVKGASVAGYAPYRSDSFIWVEGSFLVGLLDLRLGKAEAVQDLIEAMEHFRDHSGAFRYSSETHKSRASGSEVLFPSFGHIAATAWSILLQRQLSLSSLAAAAQEPASASTPFLEATAGPAPSLTLPTLFTPAGSTFGHQRLSRSSRFPSGKGPFDFRLTAGEMSLLNLLPGLYNISFLSSGGFGSLIPDGFFKALMEFLFE